MIITCTERRADESGVRRTRFCYSFVIMEERGLAEALTSDHHFEQAGFTVLLKPEG